VNYIIYDLEFNQKDNSSIDVNNNYEKNEVKNLCSMPFEIIQIGALKLNEKFQTISTFNTLVKPTVHKTIHPFVEKLTNITDAKVALCGNFLTVYEEFLKFIGDDEVVLCVWGTVDIKELLRNINFYDLSASYISKYIDIQKHASKSLKAPAKSKIGLKNAIELLNIQIEGEFHDAFNDAYYTSEVFKLIYDDSVKPIIYTSTPSRRVSSKPKEKIDMVSLINQFEKMFDRQMSKEEESIIKLAYIMGKTKQFIL